MYSQYPPYYNPEKKFMWAPISLNGELGIEGYYRTQKMVYDFLSDTQNSSRFSIGGLVDFKSYLWHPDFLMITIGAEYRPDLIKENFIVIPDQAETRTAKRLSLGVTLFNNKVITLNTLADFSQVYQNRENLTNVKTDSKQIRGLLSYSNKKLPVSISFFRNDWTQEETETGRMSMMDQMNLTGRVTKSFFSRDKHELSYSFDKNDFNYVNFYETNIRSHSLNLSDQFDFDQNGNYTFRSFLLYRSQKGSFEFNRFQANENLNIKLPLKFKFQSNYGSTILTNEDHRTVNQHIKNNLSHQLFLSLHSNIYQEYRNTRNTLYNEYDHIFGGNLNYTKKIPLKGKLNLNYNYQRQNHTTKNEQTTVQIMNESYVLTDGQITLLNRPYIEIATIVVRDETGTLIYIENIDYILIERNLYIEIQRFPGGQIANGTTVYIDYTVNLPETYTYDSNFHRLAGSISVFNGLVEVYARLSNLDFVNLENADLMTLNYLSDYQYGIRFDLKFTGGGIEYEDYQSSIIPYQSIRYYLTANKNFNDRLLVSLNGNIQQYRLIEDQVEQLYTDISGKMVYRIIDQTKASLDLGYRKQIGSGIDLDLLTARLEFMTQFRQFMFTLGLEKYNRNFLDQINNYNGIYFKLIRRF
jgi:hypothetical protein